MPIDDERPVYDKRQIYWEVYQIEVASTLAEDYGFNKFHLSGDGREVVALYENLRVFHTGIDGNKNGFLVSVSYLTNSDHIQVSIGDDVVFSGELFNFLGLLNSYGITDIIEAVLGNSLMFNASIELQRERS